MDFSKQLANLAQSASRAQRRPDRREEGNDRNERDNHRNYDDGRYRRGRGRGHGRGPSRYRREPYNGHSRNSNSRQQMTDAEEEFYLPKLIKAIPKYQPLPNIKKKKKQRHVCLLFLTIDDLPLEHIWREFFSSNDDSNKNDNLMISAICHAKFPEKVTSQWLKRRMLTHKPPLRDLQHYKERYSLSNRNNISNENGDDKNRQSLLPPMRYFSRRPEWGSTEITRAMIDLLDEGLKMGTSRDHCRSISNQIKDPQQAEEYRDRYDSSRYIATGKGVESRENIASGIASGGNINKSGSSSSREEAIPQVDRFIFVSETCLPVVTMDELESALFKDDDDSEPNLRGNLQDHSGSNKSWINARNTPNNGYARQLQWDATDESIPRHQIWKADQWIVLTRHHAWPIVSLIDEAVQSVQNSQSHGNRGGGGGRMMQIALWQCFKRVKASDEMYFPTVMALLGILNADDNDQTETVGSIEAKLTPSQEGIKNEVCKRRVTYCDWSMNAKNPASFLIDRKDRFKELVRVIRLAREEGSLFARKFHVGTTQSGEGHREEEGLAITGDEWRGLLTKIQGS